MKNVLFFFALAALGACSNPTTNADDTDKGAGTNQDLAGGSQAHSDSTAATPVTGARTDGATDLTGVDERPAEDPNAPGAAVTPDANFINSVLASGTFEIQLAQRILKDNPANADLKRFAEQMVTDHTAMGDELRKIAAAQKMNVTDRPNREQVGLLGRAEKLTGTALRDLYLQTAVTSHTTAVSLFGTAAQTVARPDLKAFAVKHLPHLEMHLKSAEALASGRPLPKM